MTLGKEAPQPMSQRQETRHVIAIVLLTMFFVLSTCAIGQEPQALSFDSRILLPNVKGRIDHFGVDVKGQRLFVAAVENHTLEVLDLKSGRRIYTIQDLAEPQGVFYDSAANRLFVACALDGVAKIFDGTTFQAFTAVK